MPCPDRHIACVTRPDQLQVEVIGCVLNERSNDRLNSADRTVPGIELVENSEAGIVACPIAADSARLSLTRNRAVGFRVAECRTNHEVSCM